MSKKRVSRNPLLDQAMNVLGVGGQNVFSYAYKRVAAAGLLTDEDEGEPVKNPSSDRVSRKQYMHFLTTNKQNLPEPVVDFCLDVVTGKISPDQAKNGSALVKV